MTEETKDLVQDHTETSDSETPVQEKEEKESSLLTGESPEEDGETVSKDKEQEASEEVEAYELSLPEGFPDENTELVSGFSEFAQANKMSKDQAQGAVDWFAERQKELIEQATASQKRQAAEWVHELRADPKVGGGKLDETVKKANIALNKFGGDEVVKVLQETGMSNHPAFVKMFAKIQKELAEDKFAPGEPAEVDERKELLDKMYPGL